MTTTPHIASGIMPIPVPYVRVRGKHSVAAQRYNKSQKRIRAQIGSALCDAIENDPRVRIQRSVRATRTALGVAPCVLVPVVVGVAVVHTAVKSGPQRGEYPDARGDWDNHLKAIVDAAVYGGFLLGDTPRWFRGPGTVELGGVEYESGVYLGEQACLIWRISESKTRRIEVPATAIGPQRKVRR